MAFSESLKIRVQRRAHFQCCLCKAIGVEIHHIIPQEDGGPDIEDNAAPLCPSCHETYGANPSKRKFIIQARDLWYEICERRYNTESTPLFEIRKIQDSLQQTASRQDIASLRREIVATIQSSAKQFHVASSNKNKSGTKLKLNELMAMLYEHRSNRNKEQALLLCFKELWPVKGGFRNVYKEFIHSFGIHTLQVVASRVLDEMKIPKRHGLTEPEIDNVMRQLVTQVILLNLVRRGLVSCLIRADGEFVWRAIKKNRILASPIN